LNMTAEQEQQQYVPSIEAQKILGISQGRFFYYVQSGQISKKPGRKSSKKRGALYSLADIHSVKEKLECKEEQKKQARKSTINGFVDWITSVEDVLTSLKLDYKVYREDMPLGDLPYYAERVVRNPHVALAVYDSEKRENILAYISLIPLPEQVILEVLRGDRHETKIQTEEVEDYSRAGEYTLLAESVVVDPSHSEQLNILLRHLVRFWCDQYPDRYISKVYAQAESNQGDILISKLFMSPREDLAKNAYVLNLARPGASRFVRWYQSCIEQKSKSLESDPLR
jgi:hypothetical protein